MSRILPLLLAAIALLAADSPWIKVQALSNRSELRIYQKGAREPLTATLADATEDHIVVVAKNKQLTIAKQDIDRIDARPPSEKKPPEVTTTEKTSDPDYTPRPPGAGPALPSASSTSSVSFGGNKGDFKTVYIRPPASSKK